MFWYRMNNSYFMVNHINNMILWSTINDQFLGLKEAFSWWTKVNFLRNLNPLEVNKNWINDI